MRGNLWLIPAGLSALLLCVPGCGNKVPNKAVVEKKIRDGLAAKSSEWKDITIEMKLDGTLTTAGASRIIDGKSYWFSFTGSEGNGGVAVRSPAGEWLCKYFYEKGKEVKSEKMTGTEDDIKRLQSVAAEFGLVCADASLG